ncbi:hypothetical protein PENTCL1PPCAC_16482, partial [Pristionchus entomophagus]
FFVLFVLITITSSIVDSSENDHIPELLNSSEDETADITVATNSTELSKIQRSFINGVVSSFSMIFTSEILDKTFFITIVMAMRHNRIVVYVGAIAALALMTMFSTTLGVLTTFVPRWITYYLSAALMFGFSIKMFYEAYTMKAHKGQDEFEEIERDVTTREKDDTDPLLESSSNANLLFKNEGAFRNILKIFAETFALTFLAEWGDKSQAATVLLAATNNVWGVLVGGVFGHGLCTGMAVIGGRAVARCISIRTVTIIGGIVFLVFAVLALVLNDFNPTMSA